MALRRSGTKAPLPKSGFIVIQNNYQLKKSNSALISLICSSVNSGKMLNFPFIAFGSGLGLSAFNAFVVRFRFLGCTSLGSTNIPVITAPRVSTASVTWCSLTCI
ncbi:hypothetical protein VCRA2116O30_470017 [Vibrio crassostreae]|nr:hypothetical protein VCRA2113O20_440004 [Vibrio crassostreae]CAK2115133.1 hypothetical protein VCRA2119O45_470003 [Vibrio crassostreae]CAK2116277.1 hypothetical protein VCRA2116O30_470017 [Vibrio crassostreae]CAK2364781.1 hypothetical protein VCRA2119O49_460003 [Vibrio crassostreae]CAK2402769.1 hypothetical protein VCRA2119O52_1160018 [Vibrio crassostreae]